MKFLENYKNELNEKRQNYFLGSYNPNFPV